MIRLMFQKSNVFFVVTVKGKTVLYYDKLQGQIWGGALQYLPPDPNLKKQIMLSRNKVPQQFIEMLEVTKEELAEFEKAKDENELKDLIIRDCQKNGCKLIDMKIE